MDEGLLRAMRSEASQWAWSGAQPPAAPSSAAAAKRKNWLHLTTFFFVVSCVYGPCGLCTRVLHALEMPYMCVSRA